MVVGSRGARQRRFSVYGQCAFSPPSRLSAMGVHTAASDGAFQAPNSTGTLSRSLVPDTVRASNSYPVDPVDRILLSCKMFGFRAALVTVTVSDPKSQTMRVPSLFPLCRFGFFAPLGRHKQNTGTGSPYIGDKERELQLQTAKTSLYYDNVSEKRHDTR